MTPSQIKLLADLRSGAWRLVPGEADGGMLGAVNWSGPFVKQICDAHGPNTVSSRQAKLVYKAMLTASPDLSASLAEMIEGLVEQVEYWPETSKHWEARALASEARVSELQAENEKLREALAPFAQAAKDCGVEDDLRIGVVKPADVIWEGAVATSITYGDVDRARALAKDHPNGQG